MPLAGTAVTLVLRLAPCSHAEDYGESPYSGQASRVHFCDYTVTKDL